MSRSEIEWRIRVGEGRAVGTVEAIEKRGCACKLGGADGAGDLNPERRREGARL
jgi:hypothetical protein